jgi:hypothetical protein
MQPGMTMKGEMSRLRRLGYGQTGTLQGAGLVPEHPKRVGETGGAGD